jgi:formylglycine-generating enzyme required for sulfatase activity/plastocyanin
MKVRKISNLLISPLLLLLLLLLISGCGGGAGGGAAFGGGSSQASLTAAQTGNGTGTDSSTVSSGKTGTFTVTLQLPKPAKSRKVNGKVIPYGYSSLKVAIQGEATTKTDTSTITLDGDNKYQKTISDVPVGLNVATIQILDASNNVLAQRTHGFYMTAGGTETTGNLSMGVSVKKSGSNVVYEPANIDVPPNTTLCYENIDYDNDVAVQFQGGSPAEFTITKAGHASGEATPDTFNYKSQAFTTSGQYNYNNGTGRVLVSDPPSLTSIADVDGDQYSPELSSGAVTFTLAGTSFGASQSLTGGTVKFKDTSTGVTTTATIGTWNNTAITGTVTLSQGSYFVYVTSNGASTCNAVYYYKAFWFWQNPKPQGNSLQSVWGSSGNDVFAVGYNGTISHYDGSNWTAQASGTTDTLESVWGSSSTDVFAVGESGKILHYDGSNWTAQTSGTYETLYGIWGSSNTDVFAVGGGGKILHYDGSNWTAQNSGTTNTLYGVWGSSSNDIFAVGGSGKILHYDGSNWTAQASGTTDTLESVWGSSSTDVFAVGSYGSDGIILHYDGFNWSSQSGPSHTLTGIWGSSGTNVFIAGGDGTILHYDGSSWNSQMSGTNKTFYGIWGSSGTDAFAVGSGGKILHYDGSSWTDQASGTTDTLESVWGSSGTDIFAVGYDKILHYDGISWTTQLSGLNYSLYGVWGSSGIDVYAVGNTGQILHYNGSNWSAQASGTTNCLESVWGSSGTDVFAVGSSGTILHYNGSNWSSQTSGTTNHLYCIWGSSSNDVFAAGYNGTILHYDGSSWSPQSSGSSYTFYCIWGSSGNDVFAGTNDKILHYDGSNWSVMVSGTGTHPYAIWGSSGASVFTVNPWGKILHYDGSNWTAQNSGTSNYLYGLWGSSATDIFAVGESGTILHFYKPTSTADPVPDNPTITGLSKRISQEGEEITITGSGFRDQASGTVTFGGVAATAITSWSDTNIVLTVPAGAKSGPLVVTAYGLSSSNNIGFTVMKAIDGGTFTMGSNSIADAQPTHSVTVSPFFMGKFEVTNAEYCAFLNDEGNLTEGGTTWWEYSTGSETYNGIEDGGDGATPRYTVRSGFAQRPVVFVSWYGTVAFCNWASEKDGLTPCYGDKDNRGTEAEWRTRNGYRLATEAENEYACRAGTTTSYYWGDDAGQIGANCWWYYNSSNNHHDIGSKAANAFGLYDIRGNVWEYCNDWYYGSYSSGAATDPTGPGSGPHRVIRGGSWTNTENELYETAWRHGVPADHINNIGFRLVRNK